MIGTHILALRRQSGELDIPSPADFLIFAEVQKLVDGPTEVHYESAEDFVDALEPSLSQLLEDRKLSCNRKLAQLVRNKVNVPNRLLAGTCAQYLL